MDNKYSLPHWPLSLRVLATCFIVSSLAGYAVGILKIYQLSRFNIAHASTYYAGDKEKDEMALNLPQSYEAMLSITHVHSFSQPLFFGLMGLIFVFTSLSERRKGWMIGMLYLACLGSNAGPWLIKYQSISWIYLMVLFQAVIACVFLSMAWQSLRQLWCGSTR